MTEDTLAALRTVTRSGPCAIASEHDFLGLDGLGAGLTRCASEAAPMAIFMMEGEKRETLPHNRCVTSSSRT